jgi:hypothetical protein
MRPGWRRSPEAASWTGSEEERWSPPAEAAGTTTGKAGAAGLGGTGGAASGVIPLSSASSVSPGGKLYAPIPFLRPEGMLSRMSAGVYRTQGTDYSTRLAGALHAACARVGHTQPPRLGLPHLDQEYPPQQRHH